MGDPNGRAYPPGEETSGRNPGEARDVTKWARRPDPAMPPTLERVFIGPNGMRAAWRLFVFLSIAVIFGFVLVRLLPLLGLEAPGGLKPSGMIFSRGVGLAAVLFSAAVMARIEKRSLAEYALPVRGAFGAWFWRGAVWGFLGLSSLLLMIRAGHGFYFGNLVLGGTKLISYSACWAAAFLALGYFEEFLFRGYALYTLASGVGFWPAAVLLSALYGATHLPNPGETWMGGLSASLMGLFCCLTVRRSGGLWFAIGLHTTWDYSESFLYSVPDSGITIEGHLLNSSFHGPGWLTGGSVGPEGSALVFVILLAMFVLFAGLYREVRFPVAVNPSANEG